MSEAMMRDLQLSGLVPITLDARPIDSPERAVTNVPAAVEGFVIPYFRLDGGRLGFYRVRLFDHFPKYKQPKNTPNHLYFPPNFAKCLKASISRGDHFIILTEGEKKAAAISQLGYASVAVSGVDSWRNKTMTLPVGTELLPGSKEGSIIVKLKENVAATDGEYAKGFDDLLSELMDKKLTLIIMYDTDKGRVSYEVQRAAASLGYELRHLGLPTNRIRMVALPALPELRTSEGDDKIGADDFIVHAGKEAFRTLLDNVLSARSAFPRHPNVKDYVNKKLQAHKLNRKDAQKVAISILTELDASGIRLKSDANGFMYYFDESTRRLIRIAISAFERDLVDNGPFGNMLFERFGLGKLDRSVMGWLAQLIPTEEPINSVTPRKIIYADRKHNVVNYQINDGQYIRITSDPDEPAEVCDNGTNGMLFESDTVEPIDSSLLLQEIESQKPQWLPNPTNSTNQTTAPLSWWHSVLMDTRIRGKENEWHIKAVTLLFYLSPWLNRWKGTQLPIELIVGESGSGKSTLMALRLNTIVGRPQLRNAPSDLRDWHSSVINSGGVHVTDNIQFTDKQLRQRLSDEICRIVTEPDPHIEMRRLYSTAELARFPVDCVFSFTAISQPFPNADLINRSILIELDKAAGLNAGEIIEYGSAWESDHLHYGGRMAQRSRLNGSGRYPNFEHARAGWIAHHALFLSHLFRLVNKEWNKSYSAKHRLINFEQLMVLGAKVFGWAKDGSFEWVAEYLVGINKKIVSEADWALEGLRAWAEFQRFALPKGYKQQRWTAANMVDWFTVNDEYKDCQQLINTRRLGRYIAQHQYLVTDTTSVISCGTKQGAIMYRLVH